MCRSTKRPDAYYAIKSREEPMEIPDLHDFLQFLLGLFFHGLRFEIAPAKGYFTISVQ